MQVVILKIDCTVDHKRLFVSTKQEDWMIESKPDHVHLFKYYKYFLFLEPWFGSFVMANSI